MLTLFIVIIAFKLFNLQVVNHKYYQDQATSQRGVETTIAPKRGDIFFSSVGSASPLLVATTVTKNMVYAVPKQIIDKNAAVAKLAGHLGLSTQDLLIKIGGTGSFVPLTKNLTNDEAKQINALKVPGIYIQAQDARLYPENNLASQIIGFLGFKGNDRVGQYGVEEKFNQLLAGKVGSLGAEVDAGGRLITVASRNFTPSENGDDIYLTLDPAIQYKAQEILTQTVVQHGADDGSIIVVNPSSGAVWAMANYPDVDLNNYGKVKDASAFSNQATTADYEPGSVFKAITLASAMDTGKITPDTTYDNTGSVQVDDKVIKNSNPTELIGQQNMIQVLDQSLNTGAVFAQQQMGNDAFTGYVKKFGFGQSLNFELSNVAGNLANLNKKGAVFFATAAFGQGITVTPLQLIAAYSVFAEGGKMIKPYIVDKIVHADGQEDQTKPADPIQVIDPKTASTIAAMLVDVVENGHGKKAGVKGYYIAGKTGTAQVIYNNGQGGYDPNKNIGSFVGFGPVDNPQFLMIVRIDNPKDVKFAESTAAPAFGQMAQFILNYLQIRPSR